MNKRMTALTLVLLLFCAVLSAGAGNTVESKSFDINAYIREPLSDNKKYSVNIYDTLSLHSGSSLDQLKNKTPNIDAAGYIPINNFLYEMFTAEGMPIATLEIRGRDSGTYSNAANQKVNIKISVLDIASAAANSAAPDSITASKGFQKIHADGTASSQYYAPFDLNLRSDRCEFTEPVSNASSVTFKENGSSAALITNRTGSKRTYVINAQINEGQNQSREWLFRGSIFMNMDKSSYETLEMGTYRTLIRIELVSGA